VETESFCHLLRVRYGECDGQKVVYNARYGDYIDIASTEFLRAAWGDAMFGGGLDYRLVKQVIEWRSPARFDEVLRISVAAARIGTTSFALHIDIRVFGDNRLVATAETTYVLVKEADQKKCPIPDALRQRLEAGAPGVVVDHAGAGIQSSRP
jgi:acyl-CoA thioester hydrolase